MQLVEKGELEKNVIYQNDYYLQKEAEVALQSNTILFLQEFGQYLNFSTRIIQKSCVAFHKFSAQISYQQYDRYLYSIVCLFITLKAEDEPQPLERIVKYYLVQCQKMKLKELGQFDNQLSNREQVEQFFEDLDPEKIQNFRSKFCDAEMFILKHIGYNFVAEGTSLYLKIFAQSEFYPRKNTEQFANSLQRLENEFYRPNFCLYVQPAVLATAIITQAANEFNVEIKSYKQNNNNNSDDFSQSRWFYKVFINALPSDLTNKDIEDILLKYSEYYKIVKGLQ